MIKKIICLSLLLCTLSACYPGFKFFNFNPINQIQWSSDRKIRWSDFKARKKSMCRFEPYASPYCQIGFLNNRLNKTNITTYFVPDSSWVASIEAENPLLLSHVQGHFDITEIHKRKMIKTIYEQHLEKSTFEKEFKIIENCLKACYEEIQKYSIETNNGTLEEKQNEWTKNIEMRLATE